ncbi:MAG: hypothetical protein AAB581_01820, partial [Patescibacteria group bacterium]
MHISEQNLKKIVTGSGVISDAQFEAARQEAARMNRTVENVLIGKGDITEAYFGEIVSGYLNIPTINFNTTPLDDAALHLLPEAFSKTKRISAFAHDPGQRTVKVAMED